MKSSIPTRAGRTAVPQWLRFALAAVVAFGFTSGASADQFVIDYTDFGKEKGRFLKLGLITVTVKDKDNTDKKLVALVDTGNSNGPGINQKTADALGLTVTGAGNLRGSGDGAAKETKKVGFNGDKSVKVEGVTVPDGQTEKSITISGEGHIAPGALDDSIILGMDFLENYIHTFDPGLRKLTLTTFAQRNNRPNVGPNQAPAQMQPGPGANEVTPGLPALEWIVPLPLRHGPVAVDASFAIATGYELSLISESLADRLGIDRSSLPDRVIGTDLGDTTVDIVELAYQLFPGDRERFAQFGILLDADNFHGVNVLGYDILSRYGQFQLDPFDNTLSAGVAPEPSVLALFGTAIGWTVMRAVRQRRG